MSPATVEPRSPARVWILRTVGVMWVLAWIGCSSPPQSTRMTADDLETVSRELAGALSRSQQVAGRGADSPLWVVSIDKVQNLSSDVMTGSEQWSVVRRVQGSLPIRALWDQKNIRFVIPPERTEAVREDNPLDGFGKDRSPNHQMSVTFRSVTRADTDHRTELYYIECVLIELSSGQRIWSDKFEYKREAVGHIWD